MPGSERFVLYLYIADGHEGEDLHRYVVEHWFDDQPGIETVVVLFEEAKQHFALLYPDVDAENYDVDLRRLRSSDTGWYRHEAVR